MSKKKIRFNYFVPHLVDIEDEDANVRWNMKTFIDYILGHKHKELNTAVPLGDEVSDLEWETTKYDEKNNIYYFQLSKNRSKDIPSKKELNHDKTPLELENDEYIGEFNLLIYDAKYEILAVQSNFFGLTTKQIQTSLSILRQRVKDNMEQSEENNPKGVVLEPLIDPSEISKVKKHKIYRKIVVKGSDYNFAAADDYEGNPLNKAIRNLSELGGVNFNIEISMGRSSKGKSLSEESVRDIIDEVLEIKDTNDVSMNIASKKEENDALDIINLIEPRLTSTVEMEVESRTTIASESLYTNFCEQNYLVDGKSTSFRTKASRISGFISEN